MREADSRWSWRSAMVTIGQTAGSMNQCGMGVILRIHRHTTNARGEANRQVRFVLRSGRNRFGALCILRVPVISIVQKPVEKLEGCKDARMQGVLWVLAAGSSQPPQS